MRMKKNVTLAALCSCLMLFSACSKSSVPSGEAPSHVIHLTVHAEKGLPEGDTRIGYDWSQDLFTFEEGDMMQILIGKTEGNSFTSQTSARIPMDEDAPGFFSGSFDLGEYDLTDIRGAVLVRSATPTDNYKLGFYNSAATVNYTIPRSQTQSAKDVLTDDTGRFMFYAPIDQSVLIRDDEDGTSVSITKLAFKPSSGLWEYHIYGAGRGDEKVESVSIAAAGSSVAVKYLIAATHKVNVSSGGHQAVNSPYYYDGSVTLGEPFSVPETRAEAGVVWHSLYGSSAVAKELSAVTVVTDKAVYKRSMAGVTCPETPFGHVCPIYIDLSAAGGFTRYSKGFEVSTDGGSTWSEWDDALPSGTAFTSLAVRSGSVLTSSRLGSIVTWVNGQSGTVSLDLLGVEYESITFPAVFGNATAASASKKLGFIRFPSNVTTLANNCLRNCTNLTGIDLSNITAMGTAGTNCYALSSTGLTTVDLPAIKTTGHYIFRYCASLVSATICSEANKANSISLGGHFFNGCTHLEHVWCYATTPPSINGNTKNIVVSAGSEATVKQIHVPANVLSAYAAADAWKNATTGYTLTAIE